MLKFGLSEKNTKFERNLPHGFDKSTDLVNVKTMRNIFSNYVCFSKCLNFTYALSFQSLKVLLIGSICKLIDQIDVLLQDISIVTVKNGKIIRGWGI